MEETSVRMQANTENTGRIAWCDIAKCICIFFVIFSHQATSPAFLRHFFVPFFLALFFFLSGYVYKNKTGFFKLMRQKALTLLVPVLFTGLIDFVIERIVPGWSHDPLTKEIAMLFLQIREQGDKLWFVVCLFVAFIPFYFILKLRDKRAQIAVSTVLGICGIAWGIYVPGHWFPWGTNALPWHIPTALVACHFMVVANVIRNSGDFLQKNRPLKQRAIMTLSSLAIYVTLLILNARLINRSPIGINYWGRSILWYLLVSWVSVFTMIFVSQWFRPGKLLLYIGRHTLIYFMLQSKCYTLIELILEKTGLMQPILSHIVLQTVVAFAETAVICLILLLPAFLIERYFPFVIGKWYPKRQKPHEDSHG